MADISIRDFIAKTDENGNVISSIVESKPKTKNYATYEVVENSGVDIIIKRTLNKDVQYMAIIASQGQYYIKKEKTGEIFRVDDAKYRTFWSGLKRDGEAAHSFVIPTTSEYDVYDRFELSNRWSERLAYAIKDETFVNLAKAGLMTLSQWVNLSTPSWMGGRYTSDPNVTKDMVKIIKYCVAKLMESGMSKAQAIESIYGSYGKMDEDAVHGFIIMSWVYSWEVAFKAIDEYMANDLLNGFEAYGLCNILTCTRDGGRDNNRGYGGYNYRSSPSTWHSKEIVEDVRKHGQITVFEPNRLIEYMFNEALECGSGDNIKEWCGEWSDALANQNYVYGKLVEKYPANLPLYHDKIAYRYRINKKYYDQQKWEKAAKRCAVYETTWKDWILKAPKTTDDILDEAQQMSNCVASYVQRVIDGDTNILFLRLKDAPDVSVCTVEIRNDVVVQFKARRNATPSKEQRDALLALIKKNRQARDLPVGAAVPPGEYFKV